MTSDPMLVVDTCFHIVARSPDFDRAALDAHVARLLSRHLRKSPSGRRSTVEVIDATTTLRVTDLSGERGAYYAITVERAARDPIDAVASDNRLTRREREVLRMLLDGSSDNDISARLCIAPSTASDHARNILRKTGSNKRAELFAKVIRYDGRLAVELGSA